MLLYASHVQGKPYEIVLFLYLLLLLHLFNCILSKYRILISIYTKLQCICHKLQYYYSLSFSQYIY